MKEKAIHNNAIWRKATIILVSLLLFLNPMLSPLALAASESSKSHKNTNPRRAKVHKSAAKSTAKQAAKNTPPEKSNAPAATGRNSAAPGPKSVKKGPRSVRSIQTELRLSSLPSDKEIRRARIFPEPLISTSNAAEDSNNSENQDLALALKAFHTARSKGNISDFGPLQKFITSHPNSKWNPSLELNLGLLYCEQGYLSRALRSWEFVWKSTKDKTDGEQKSVADRAVTELLLLCAHLGRTEEIKQYLAAIKNRKMTGSNELRIDAARGGLACMSSTPEVAFKCGPFAINSILNRNAKHKTRNPIVEKYPSTIQGTNLAQVKELADSVGLKYQLAKRSPGATIITPSVMHWKVGHFAALLSFKNGKYEVKDPTFGVNGNMWLVPGVINEETDGYFLVPAGPLPKGWSPLSKEEAANVWGKGGAVDRDEEAKTPSAPKTPVGAGMPGVIDPRDKQLDPCSQGMAVASVFTAQDTLSISDTPLGYSPPAGPSIPFSATYSYLEANQPSVMDFTNLGANWTFNWVSYLTVDSSQNALVRVMGGGTERFDYTGDSGNPYYPHYLSQASISQISSTNYQRISADGSVEIFNQPGGSSRIFMTEYRDPQGNSVYLQYDDDFRLETITDTIGQASTITYVSNTSSDPGFYKISQIEDPFGRTCSFTYDSSVSYLVSITDVIGLTSEFTYDTSSSFISLLTTPYGSTSFYRYSPRPDSPILFGRGLRILYPDGTSMVMENYLGHELSTYTWSRDVLKKYPSDPANQNYTHCVTTSWFESTVDPRALLSVVRSIKPALSEKTEFTYQNQGALDFLPVEAGTINSPLTSKQMVSQSPPVYTTQAFEYNTLGKMTKVTDPIGREFSMTYASNKIDLLEVRETKSTDDFLIGKWTYNSVHLPLTYIDGSGQTTTYDYNSYGQLTSVTDADSNTSTYTYDSDGYLLEIDGPLTGDQDVTTFTYDGYGRLYTATNSEGYTLTYTYDNMDRITRVTAPDGTNEQIKYLRLDAVASKDRNGRWTTSSFDNMRQLAYTIDPLGRKTQYHWCNCGSIGGITDPAGNTTTWEHDIQGRITNKTYADDSEINITYDSFRGLPQTVTDALSQVKTFTYNLDNTLAQIAYSNSVHSTSNVSFTYDQKFPRRLTAQNGWGTRTYSFNDYITDPTDPPITGGGMLASITNNVIANSGITFAYDALGRTTNRSINTSANSTTWSFDAISRITSEVNELGTFNFAYVNNTSGSSKGDPRLSSITYPNSQVTNFSYYNNAGDERLQQIENLNPSSAVLSKFNYAYNAAGEITSWQQEQNGKDLHQDLQYDLAGQLVGSLSGSGKAGPPYTKQDRYSYDLASNRSAVQTDQIELARIGGTITAADTLTITIYDKSLSGGSKAINYTVQSGDTLASAASNFAAAISSDSDLIALGVNAAAAANLTTIRSLSPNITTFTKSTSGGATETITLGGVFNGSSNATLGGTATASDTVTITVVNSALSGGHQDITYTVQSGDTLADIASGLASAINSDSDMQGIQVSASAASGVVSVRSLSINATTYTSSTSGGATETIKLSPNVNGAHTALIAGSKTTSDILTVSVFDAGLAGGHEDVAYTVQSGDTLVSITSGIASAINGNSNLAAIGVTASAISTILNLSSNSTHATTYTQTTSGGATETITLSADIGVTKSAFNNVNEIQNFSAGGLIRFEGTTNKPVKSVTINSNPAYLNWSKSFAGSGLLSAGANTTSIVGTDGDDNTKTNTYKLFAKGAATTNFTYDANGNITNDGTNTYEWDAENRLTKITRPGSGNYSQFVYDALGNRVKELEYVASSLTTTKQNIWCNSQICEQRNASNGITAQFFSLGETDGTNDRYYTFDHLGSIREVTSSAGATLQQNAYSPYGTSTLLQGSSVASFSYAGMYSHQQTALNLTLFRQYNSSIGRWLSRDPLGESMGTNLYAYIDNIPVSGVDPLGLGPVADIWTGAGAFIGGTLGGTAGAAGGTLIIPGVGTLAGGVELGGAGAIVGGAWGHAIGTVIEKLSGLGSGASLGPTSLGGYGSGSQITTGNSCAMGKKGTRNPHPANAEPDTTKTWTKENGETTTRVYGPNGNAIYDIDSPHRHDTENHIHPWENGKRGVRQPNFSPLP